MCTTSVQSVNALVVILCIANDDYYYHYSKEPSETQSKQMYFQIV